MSFQMKSWFGLLVKPQSIFLMPCQPFPEGEIFAPAADVSFVPLDARSALQGW